ncbi:MAG: hypothetical protein MI861_06885, partial [Pirellulales bacterium]|nr:hypothetical protein [Pirellulales bacterium]
FGVFFFLSGVGFFVDLIAGLNDRVFFGLAATRGESGTEGNQQKYKQELAHRDLEQLKAKEISVNC